MIAQKIVDAKHSKEPGHPPIAEANLLASTSWASSAEHDGYCWLMREQNVAALWLLPARLRTVGINGGSLDGQAGSQ